MRCRCCNTIITNNTAKNSKTRDYEDLCKRCISLSYDSFVDKEYEHGKVTGDDIYILTGYDKTINPID